MISGYINGNVARFTLFLPWFIIRQYSPGLEVFKIFNLVLKALSYFRLTWRISFLCCFARFFRVIFSVLFVFDTDLLSFQYVLLEFLHSLLNHGLSFFDFFDLDDGLNVLYMPTFFAGRVTKIENWELRYVIILQKNSSVLDESQEWPWRLQKPLKSGKFPEKAHPWPIQQKSTWKTKNH